MRKWVLVTGSSRGIGASIIRKFASLDYNVVINYNNSKNEALMLKEEVEKKYGIEALAIKADVTKEEEVKDMFLQLDSLDVLVNNAGISLDDDWQEKSALDFLDVLNTNLVGTFLASKYATRIMDYGVIINIASNAGIDDLYPDSMDYDASKAGVISLTHNLAKSLSPDIRVNAVAPGWVITDMTKEMSVEYKKEVIDKCLLKRMAQPEEIAEVVAFLASDKASFINDAIIKVDGGLK